MLALSDVAKVAIRKSVKTPQIVLCIDGIDSKFGSGVLLQIERIGDADLLIGSSTIGGFRQVEGQKDVISWDGSSQSIKQQLDQDKGRGSSVSSLQIALIDKHEEITQLISSGVVVDDILARKCQVYLGFSGETLSSFPEDYTKIFVGVIEDVQADPSLITLTISHPDQKKRQTVYATAEAKLSGSINASQTTIPLTSIDNFLLPVIGPDLSYDASFASYITVNEEVIKYTGISGLDLTGCTRAQFGTFANPHAADDAVKSFYRLQGNSMDLSLKLMLSGRQNYFTSTSFEATHFEKVERQTGVEYPSDTIFFRYQNLSDTLGIVVGDYITTTGASNGSNNVTLKQITALEIIDDVHTLLTVSGVSFVGEYESSAVAVFRSQYDTLPVGLKMAPDEVDVAEHLRLKQLFLSSFNYDFYLKDTITNAKDFLEEELYKPATCFSLPRKGKSSVGIHSAPIPSATVQKFDKDNIVMPSKIKVKRGINKNFANTIIYKIDEDPIEDKFLTGKVTISATSLSQIPIGNRAMVIESKGMRTDLNGSNLAVQAANKRLNRYKFGAESIDGLKTTFGDGFNTEVGDVVILDPTDLKVVNTTDGNREKEATFYEVVNKSLNIKTGETTLDLVDTNFNGAARYCLISPSSRIKTVISNQSFVIESVFNSSAYGASEFEKWKRFRNPAVKIRSANFTTRFAQAVIDTSNSNTITLVAPLPFTPVAGDFMELADYDFASTAAEVKLLYGFMKDSAFADGKPQYWML